MPQERYETMLLDRAHARRRWENQPAVDVTLDDLDHEEILRTRETAIAQRRISVSTSADAGDILDTLISAARRDHQAAQVLTTRACPTIRRRSCWGGFEHEITGTSSITARAPPRVRNVRGSGVARPHLPLATLSEARSSEDHCLFPQTRCARCSQCRRTGLLDPKRLCRRRGLR